MEFKDYYKIMKLTENASADDIKKSYRKLARKYHPDVSKEKDAEKYFKEMKEAYEVLKDPEKRAAYDKLRKGGWQAGEKFQRPNDWQRQTWNSDTDGYASSQANFSDFFEELFGRQRNHNQTRTDYTRGQAYSTQFRVRGEDIQHILEITLEEVLKGSTRTVQLTIPENDKQGRTINKKRVLNVKIPPGVTQGQLIRLQGQGLPGEGGGGNGDLYLKIQIAPHNLYHLEGLNLLLNLPIAPWEAALGATLRVPTLAGVIEVKIPPGSQTGNKLRLKGRGLPGNPPGDQLIILKIMIPLANSEEAKNIYKEMAEKLGFNPRQHLGV